MYSCIGVVLSISGAVVDPPIAAADSILKTTGSP